MADPAHAPPQGAPVVLVADDEDVARGFVARVLRSHGMEVHTVTDGPKAIDRALVGDIDVVLLDVVMPNMGGLECCRLIKAQTRDRFLPVLLVTVLGDSDSRVEGLRIGADDYVAKPFDERELVERVTALLRIKHAHDELADAKRRLQELAIHDELTGLYNYRYLHDRLEDEFKRAQRYGTPLACVMADLDHFKRINDEHGHLVGDHVLQEVARRLQAEVREVDVVARYGGEEFLLILPQTAGDDARLAADRIRACIGDVPVTTDDRVHEITVSAGVAVYPAPGIGAKDDLLKAADRALYQAKEEGRNRVCVAGPPK